MQLAGTSVLLTGASGGIGQAIARALDDRGARLLLTARRTDALEQLAPARRPRPRCSPADLADAAGPPRSPSEPGRSTCSWRTRRCPASGAVVDFSPEQIDRALDVNLRAPIQLARALVPGMSSAAAATSCCLLAVRQDRVGGSSIYSATKFGLRGFAAGLREDLHGTGVGVTVVFPGFVSTPACSPSRA